MRDPSVEGWAQVGEHDGAWGVGSGEWWAAASSATCSAPLATLNTRDTPNVRVSISTTWSSIIQAEYCFVPCGFMREPRGIVHVSTRAISTMSSVPTTETDDGTISPCTLKLTT